MEKLLDFDQISTQHPEWSLKIFGEGILRGQLQQLIEKLNLSDKVTLCGVSDNIKEKLEKSKIFVLSSNCEGMPNALIEAMAIGLPVISTDCPCGGPKELIKNGENGILIKVGDTKELANKINYLIENEEEALRIGRNAEKIKQELNSENILKQWESYIKKITMQI